jgi:methionyl aminopeptidase
VELKTDGEIAFMREAGRVVAAMLTETQQHARAGVRLRDLDAVARDVLDRHGATSPFLGYQPHFSTTPFPGVICASVNDVIVHGIPGDDELHDGDLVSIDAGATLDGWSADAATTFVVGETPRPADDRLIGATRAALEAGIAAATPGARLGDVSAAIGASVRASGFGLLADHGGHGIGRTMHESPYVANDGRPGRGPRLEVGWTLALEPMLLASGRADYQHGDDGWAVLTTDGGRSAHVEHTVAVTHDGPQVLTLP